MFFLSSAQGDGVTLWYDMENASEDVQGVICSFDNKSNISGPFKVSVDYTNKKISFGVYSPSESDGNVHKLICDFKYPVGTGHVTYQTITIYIQSAPSVRPIVTYGPNDIRATHGDSLTFSLTEPYEENTQIAFDQPATILSGLDTGVGTIMFNYLDENGEIQTTGGGEEITTTKMWVRGFDPSGGTTFSRNITIKYFGSLTLNYVVEE